MEKFVNVQLTDCNRACLYFPSSMFLLLHSGHDALALIIAIATTHYYHTHGESFLYA